MPERNRPTAPIGGNGTGVIQSKVPNIANKHKSTQEEGKTIAGYSIEITKSLGNYEFVKIRASVELPHGANQQLINEMDDLVKVAKELVIKRIEEDLTTLDFLK